MLNTDITGDNSIKAVQGGLAEGVSGQLDSGGLLGGVGDVVSKQGFNRAENKDAGPIPVKDAEKQSKSWGETLSGGMVGGSNK